jgi:hypothetical protein
MRNIFGWDDFWPVLQIADLGMVTYAYNSNIYGLRQEDQEFKDSLGYIVISRQAALYSKTMPHKIKQKKQNKRIKS